MSALSSADLIRASAERGLLLADHVCEQMVASLNTGKHVVLTGPPGTGKTTLAYLAAEEARRRMMSTGYLATTATGEWTTFETIGGMQATPEGLLFRPGLFVEAILQGRWLVIDEMNRSNFDRAFGQLFTVLSGSAVVLPYKRSPLGPPVSLVPYGEDTPPSTDPIRLPAAWRIIGTMNTFDKHLLFDLSYAMMRRFTFIEVPCPPDADYHELLAREGPGSLVEALIVLRRFIELGPALYLDAARYAAQRLDHGATHSRVLLECFTSFFLPQMDRVPEERADELADTMAALVDREERAEVYRVVSRTLGVELTG